MREYAIGYLVDFLQILLFFIAVYYLAIAVFSLFGRKPKIQYDGYSRFTIIIPAHNEAEVIGRALFSLKEQDYPKEYYDIYVMADSCTDSTAHIAKMSGAYILTRSTEGNRNKGTALADAFGQILSRDKDFDFFVVLDADNIADSRFLAEVNLSIREGASVVQGYVDTLTVNQSWVSNAHALWYSITNRLMQTGFSNMGLGCKLNGTGFALSRKVLDTVPWDTTTLTEDYEYTAKLALNNINITYANKAVVYDEKPDSFHSSVRQRCRWAQGNIAVQSKYLLPMLKGGHLHFVFVLCSDFLMPLLFMLFLLTDCLAVLNLINITNISFLGFWATPINIIILNIYIAGSVFAAISALIVDRKITYKTLLNCLGFIIYLISWIPIGFWGIIRRKKTDWYHTKHNNNYN